MIPPRASRGAISALLLTIALAAPTTAAADVSGGGRRWYVPDHAKVQLAGEIGFVSPGVGYELASGRFHLDLFLGWVPASVGGKDIFSTTAKLTWLPWRARPLPRWQLVPLTVGLQLSYAYGSDYFLSAPSRYPPGYYELPTAVDVGLTAGGGVVRELRSGGVREVGLYYELVALGKMLQEWRENTRMLDASDVVSVAFGAVARF